MPQPDVLVVGAGPTGLALACSLRAHGVAARVVDAATEPATTSRANILHGRGVESLRRIGALGDLPSRAVEPLGLAMYVNGKQLLTLRLADFGDAVGTEHQALYVSQAGVEEQLRRRLSDLGGAVEWGAGLEDVESRADGVAAVLATGERLTVPWLVGCDGAHSAVRKLAGIGFPGVPVIEQFLLADVHLDWDHDRDTGAIFLHRDGVLMAIPMRSFGLADDLWRLMANVTAGDGRPGEEQIAERFRQLLAERAGGTRHRIDGTEWTSVFRIQRRLADAYRSGRILLAGDAAHIHSPVGGQGMNTGIGDAENLGWKLAMVVAAGADEALLDTYHEERRPLAADVLKTTTANTKLIVTEHGFRRLLRDRVLFPIAKLPAVQRRNAIAASQLLRSYRGGPLGSSRLTGKPRPGDRIPNRACVRADGSATQLFDELAGSWVLLLPTDNTEAYAKVAADRLGAYVMQLTRDDGRADAWLIRPDAHLVWRGTDPSGLDAVLRNVLRHGRTRR